MFYYSYSYLLYMLPGLVLMLYAQFKVKHSFSKYSKVINSRGLTGADAAKEVLRQNGVDGVRIEHVSGNLSDHYDPRTNVIRLSDDVYNSTSVAAVGVAAHEAGHAVQYAKGYGPIKLRAKIIPACNIGSQLGIPLALIGAVIGFMGLVYVGLALFGLAVLFQVVTLPVEFNASRRAISAINSTALLTKGEASGAKAVLSAAAMTYVAAMIQSLLMLLYYVSRFAGRRD
ncbi:MAG: zinc metallopeptidase [Clostridia bacterium]|nr:zinc metallopeptidase [Clostridia bacterium]MBQ9958335.1 zinc metallopeptidase [Clostridia bacterium]